MFIRRTLDFDLQQPNLAEPVLRRESIQGLALASEHLARVQAQGQALLAEAQVQGEQLRAGALADFWVQANDCLAGWEAERQALRDAVVEQAQVLLRQTLTQLLGSFDDEERALALLRQIARSQSRPVRATLRCAEALHGVVQAWLQQQPHAHWQLEADSHLAPGSLWLSTERGDFSLDWQHLSEQVLDLV